MAHWALLTDLGSLALILKPVNESNHSESQYHKNKKWHKATGGMKHDGMKNLIHVGNKTAKMSN